MGIPILLALISLVAHAGGPRFIAGNTYFNPAAAGQPVIWAGGLLSYFVDQGPLSSSVSHASAAMTVAAAAAVWNAVPTAAILISEGGALAEDVSGANVIAATTGITMPTDIESNAIGTPVAIVFDADGSVIDAFYGVGASDPDDCIDSGVISRVDNLTETGSIAHAVILINGLCTGVAAQLEQIQFQLIRAFGRVLGLDWSQANDAVLFGAGLPSLQQLEGWPMMRPIDLNCGQLSVQCVPNALQLRVDDIAAISRLHPVTAANLANIPRKVLTAPATLSIHGTIHFARGQGMQGVNVVARPVAPGVGLPDDRYPAASVSGFLFTGDSGNPITGFVDSSGTPLSQFGSTDATWEGYYDLSGISLPPGESQADYQLTLEPVNVLYTGSQSVGPYALGSPTPSGTLPSLLLRGLTAGTVIEQDFTIPDSASDLGPGTGGSALRASIPQAGEWQSRVANVGQTVWFAFPVKGGRHFTLEAQALDADASDQSDEASGANASENKLRPVLGIWNGSDALVDTPVNATVAPYNGTSIGVTALGVDTLADGELVLGVADQRGDGRPDYTFHGRLLYADKVSPQQLPLSGGTIAITGSGFHPGMVVSLQGGLSGSQVVGTVVSVAPTLLFAALPAAINPSGSLDLVITDPETNGVAAIAAGISYGDGSGDTLSLVAAPPENLGMNVPAVFTVRAFGADQVTPLGGMPVDFSVLAGTATYDGNSNGANISVLTSGDGFASASVTATSVGMTKLKAALSNGNALLAEFTATATPAISALEPPLYLAPGATWPWAPQVQLWNAGAPAGSASVTWSGDGVDTFSITTNTNPQGVAETSLTLGPWTPGTSFTLTACVAATTTCVTMPVYVVHPETEILSPVSGNDQLLPVGQAAASVVTRTLAPGGQPVVGGTVTFTGSVRAWTPACSSSGSCPLGRLLSTFAQSAISAADGTSTFSTVLPGLPQRLSGLAVAGNSVVPFNIEVSP